MQHQGKCCPSALIKNKISQVHTCTICYDTMTDPVKVNCKAGHTFGRACIYEWMTIREQNTCPYCRNPINELKNCPQLRAEINQMIIGCHYCQWSGKVRAFDNHQQYCEKKHKYFVGKLKQCVDRQKQLLNKGYMQHYSKQHPDTHKKYCNEQQLKDLDTNERQWNWWWGLNPDWNEHCETCKDMQTIYGKDMHYIDRRRKAIIQNINQEFVIEQLRDLF